MSYVTLMAAAAALTPVGIARVYEQHPETLEVADLPALWPEPANGTMSVATYSGGLVWATRTVDVVVAIMPIVMGTQGEREDARATMFDALETAIAGGFSAFEVTGFEIDSEEISVNGVAYVGLRATVTASEVR